MIYTPNLIPDGHFGKMDDKTVILFKGGHSPIEIPLKIDVGENVHYMGCYFADGTKKGHAWKINASTPEQAMYYNKIYDKLLPSEDFKFKVTYSKTPSDVRTADEITRDIKKYWEEKTDNSFSVGKVYIVDAKVDAALNRNKYGSLEIKNDKGLVMQFHQKMLDQTMEIISNSNDRKLLWDFVHGILEGDGYVAGGAERLGLGISCNIDNYEFIQDILDKLGIQFRTDTFDSDSGRSNGVQIQFGLFEILKNFKDIKDDVFQYYPKRADRLFDRMQDQSTVQHMLGKRSQSSFTRARANELKSNEITNFFKNRQL
ncbi:MAG: hypothetical protein HeimC2_20990 [Candidatus Heimdallarchaeota archaeon LC_2]|nr:MAG: hypothetical protein HeimC2_20990 [Candidatus Heimdallarchaeota archaeon LC_2]